MDAQRILVAYDGTEQSFWALQEAAEAARSEGAELGVVVVLPPIVNAPREALRYLRECGLEATFHEPVGNPVEEIARIAREGDYSTVYLGTRSGTVGRTLGSSVSRQVAVRSPVSVLIVR